MDNHLPQLASNIREELLDKLAKIQNQLKKAREGNNLARFIFVFYFISIGVYIYSDSDSIKESPVSFVLLSLFIFLVLYLFLWNGKRRHILGFKNEIIKAIVTHLIPEITYHPSDNLSASNLRGAKLFRYKSQNAIGEDLFIGKRGNTSFRFSEIKSQLEQEYQFKGILIKCFCDLPIEKSIRIYSKDAKHIYSSKNMQLIDLSKPHPLLSEQFKVIGYPEEDYINILNNKVLSQSLDIKETFQSPVYVSLFPKSAHIAIETEYNYFEPDLNKAIDIEQVNRIYNEIIQCLLAVDIIDEISTGANSEKKRLKNEKDAF